MSEVRIDQYFRRFGFCDRKVAAAPDPDLGTVVVIPCYGEPELLVTLEALWRCDPPRNAVEVLVVINSSDDSPPEVRQQNETTLGSASAWIQAHQRPGLAFHLLDEPFLPAKHAGVGLARKIGMDEALWRFADVGRDDQGVIACFDADSRCDLNYLRAIESHFLKHPDAPGCSIYFEHPLEGRLAPTVYEAIARYELHLRYYIQGLRFAGVPHAYHTVGSAMAVRAGVYREQGGMNKRRAGEDFYFLHKIIPLPGFMDLLATRVIPSPRASDRVPFGTGRAVANLLAGGPWASYPVEVFDDLKMLSASIDKLANMRNLGTEVGRTFSPPLSAYLQHENAWSAVEEIRANSSSLASFRQRFWRWFNGFRTMKFVHFARDTQYGAAAVEVGARLLWQRWQGPPWREARPGTAREWLECYRELDRVDYRRETEPGSCFRTTQTLRK